MKITYQGLNITHSIQGTIQIKDFAVSHLNAGENPETLSIEEQAAQVQFDQDRKELLAKILSEQDSEVKEEFNSVKVITIDQYQQNQIPRKFLKQHISIPKSVGILKPY